MADDLDDALPWGASPAPATEVDGQINALRSRLGYFLSDVDVFEDSADPSDFFDHARKELKALLSMAEALQDAARS